MFKRNPHAINHINMHGKTTELVSTVYVSRISYSWLLGLLQMGNLRKESDDSIIQKDRTIYYSKVMGWPYVLNTNITIHNLLLQLGIIHYWLVLGLIDHKYVIVNQGKEQTNFSSCHIKCHLLVLLWSLQLIQKSPNLYWNHLPLEKVNILI